MPSVCEAICELSRRHAGRTALIDVSWDTAAAEYRLGASVTYDQLFDQTLRLAAGLESRGVLAGDRIAVLLDNSAELVVSEWACLLSGTVWVALNVRSSPSEHSMILEDCAPSVLLVSSRYRQQLGDVELPPACQVIEVGDPQSWDALLAGAEPRLPLAFPGPEDLVRIRYTSGTSGLPKGAMLPRRCYDASLEVVSDVIGPLHSTDVLAQVAPMTHAAGAMWLPHAVAGATALLLDRFDADAFADLAVGQRVTSAFLVPTMLVRLVEALDGRSEQPSTLRSIVYGGASMPVDRLERGLELLGPVFVQIYGLTESNWPVTALRREEHFLPSASREAQRQRLRSCGRPTAVGEIRIVSQTAGTASVDVEEAGELLVRGRNTMAGYWGKGRSDAKGLDEQGWMHTGDVAVRDADGFVTIVDRLHDMMVSGGFNVYPREVEDALSSHPSVLESAVVGLPDAEWGERIHAVVVLRPGMTASDKELADHVAERTAAYKKPRSFRFVAELPKNAAGKILRRALKTTTPPT